jgi:hypothetical protein
MCSKNEVSLLLRVVELPVGHQILVVNIFKIPHGSHQVLLAPCHLPEPYLTMHSTVQSPRTETDRNERSDNRSDEINTKQLR